MAELMQVADYLKVETYRQRVHGIVDDEATAEALKTYYNVNCKRPTFHDDYLPSFNRPNVSLVDVAEGGIERIVPQGIVAGGRTYGVDCIIFATGFEAFSRTYVTGEYSVVGRDGQTLEEKWNRKFVTLHGVLTHGFPNMVLVGHMRDGGGSTNSNFPFHHQSIYAAKLIRKTIDKGAASFDVTEAAEDGWRAQMRAKAPPIQQFLAECTPGYLNNEGNVDETALRFAIYGGGSIEYAEILAEWRDGDGAERDLTFVGAQ